RSLEYAEFTEKLHPYGIQLFGTDHRLMVKILPLILKIKPDFIDINMGCPVKKVVKRGAGAALIKEPARAADMVKALREALPPALPLSVKIRSGWDKYSINAEEVALRLEEAGADIICLHPRTRSQMYAGRSDWNLIFRLKQQLHIPLIGNGDVRTPQDALTLFAETGCDSIMIGRGALGNPWIFREIKDHLSAGNSLSLTREQKFDIISQHCKLVADQLGEERAVIEIRAHLSYYTKGFRDGSAVRNYLNRSLDLEDILQKVKDLYYGQS
ncbi:MAG: tRNA-dihydrouridine synthase, partial [Candidatus Cloacimonetes bacterium]|nr:tRNA-dihydrouridine synthase [Candidatus Cloacimonadota bacterium]